MISSDVELTISDKKLNFNQYSIIQATEGYGYLSLMKTSEHYRQLGSVEDVRNTQNPEIEITLDQGEEQSKEQNNRRGSAGIVSNITNVFRFV